MGSRERSRWLGEPIAQGKYDVVPRGIPGGILDEEKEVFESDSPLDLAKAHGHRNVTRAVSLHTVSVGYAAQDNDSFKSVVGISFTESLEFGNGTMKTIVGFPLIVG